MITRQQEPLPAWTGWTLIEATALFALATTLWLGWRKWQHAESGGHLTNGQLCRAAAAFLLTPWLLVLKPHALSK